MALIKISVRNMVEFVYRSGNIDSGYMSGQRAADGVRIHKKIQNMRKAQAKKNGSSYESEYTFKLEFEYKDCSFKLEGRADGLIISNDKIIIEEIKSTTKDISEIDDSPDHWHWAQAKCYGHMYMALFGIDEIGIDLTYCTVESGEHKTFRHDFTKSALEEFFYATIDKYYAFAKMDMERIERRNKTAKTLDFPFGSYRNGQRELAISVYAAIKGEKNLFAHAPTGIGKTVSTVYPAVKALEQGLIEKVFYLTSRNTGRIMATDCLRLLEECGLNLVSVNLSAKTKICVLGEPSCNPSDCLCALGHFDRINEAILDIMSGETIITKEIIETYAAKHQVCPFEMGLDLTYFCDFVIGDYNYVYDPTAKLKRYFGGELKNNFAILIDEAHNMVDRARDMFSAELNFNNFSFVYSLLKGTKIALRTKAGKVKNMLTELGDSLTQGDYGTAATHALPDTLYYVLHDFQAQMDIWLGMNQGNPDFAKMLEIYFNVMDFLRIFDIYDDSFITMVTKNQVGRGVYVDLQIICLDPSFQIAQCNKTVKSTIYFSATLSHMDFFTGVLGGVENDFRLAMPSPFKRENLCVMVNTSISTKYKDRRNSYKDVVQMVYASISQKCGNYLVFFPSYAYMEDVYSIFAQEYAHVNTIMQVRGDSSGDFLENFKTDNEENLLGFAVLGAGYSEGIDLAGDLLIGVIVVGVGLPMICLERDSICDYYNEKNGDGYGYAYRYPGMNKVMQAGGRVIRKEDDRGFILLIDRRYATDEYLQLIPNEWRGFAVVQNPEQARTVLGRFWGEGIF